MNRCSGADLHLCRYEMCTYTRPFEASNQAALMLKILRGKYDESAIAARLYSPELQEIVSACLTMDPSFRPVSDSGGHTYASLGSTC